MVADTVWVALASGGSAVAAAAITAYINRQNTRDQIEAQQKQLESRLLADRTSRRAEFYVDHKIEVLTDLYSVVEELHYTFKTRGPYFGKEEADVLKPAIEAFDRNLNRAVIYLEQDESEAFYNLLESYREFEEVLRGTPPEPSVDSNHYDEFVERLNRELEEKSPDEIDPDLLEDYELLTGVLDYQKSNLNWDGLAEYTGEVQRILEAKLAEPIAQFEST